MTFDLIFEDGEVFPSGYGNTYPRGQLALPRPLPQEEANRLGDLLIRADLVDRVLL
jgi:hypothetical protein